ncbi:MAG: DinB family protein [Chloroflexi bacterium]|nr:DinB family protein [Chloroflexota bacterium]MDA1003912.1 DinB family protein [Chloroflexota bacterium]
MTEPLTLQHFYGRYVRSLLTEIAEAIADLSDDELNRRSHEDCNSIGFDAWHVARTADNLVHFAFDRERPLWLSQGLDETWGLPKVDQGTGMAPPDAHALRFPPAAELTGYITAVRDAIVPRIEAMTDEYLASTTTIRPHGELSKAQIIGQVIINHGNNHLGMISTERTLLGKSGLGF